MKLTYFGHSAFSLELSGANLLFDPFITGNPHCEGVVQASDLEPDVILLTHAHGDHWGDTPGIAKRTGAHVVANFEIAQYLASKHGHGNSTGMNIGGAATFDWGRVVQTYASHSSSFPDGAYGGNPGGFVVEADGHCVYAAGDTGPFAEMAWLGEEYDIDVALVPVGDVFTMGPASSLRAIRMLKPKIVVPIHYDTFPPIRIDVAAWADSVRSAGFTPQVMRAGETLEI